MVAPATGDWCQPAMTVSRGTVRAAAAVGWTVRVTHPIYDRAHVRRWTPVEPSARKAARSASTATARHDWLGPIWNFRFQQLFQHSLPFDSGFTSQTTALSVVFVIRILEMSGAILPSTSM